VVDFDDGNLLSTNTDYLQYETFKERLLVMPSHVVKKVPLKPRIAAAAYAGGVFNSYMNTTGWLDVASPSVEHYGVKVGLAQTPTTTISYQVMARFSLAFKNPR